MKRRINLVSIASDPGTPITAQWFSGTTTNDFMNRVREMLDTDDIVMSTLRLGRDIDSWVYVITGRHSTEVNKRAQILTHVHSLQEDVPRGDAVLMSVLQKNRVHGMDDHAIGALFNIA